MTPQVSRFFVFLLFAEDDFTGTCKKPSTGVHPAGCGMHECSIQCSMNSGACWNADRSWLESHTNDESMQIQDLSANLLRD